MTLELRDVTVRFADTTVLDGVSLTVADGEVLALLGPSGSGKSTLLRVVAGIVAPDAGTVTIDGVDVTATPTHRRGVGMVFQDNQLFPHRSTAENVAFGLRMAGVGAAERRRRADEWLTRVGLDGFGERRVTDLSGGEAKRVALARTMATEPAVVLLDEPLTGLDRQLHDQLADELAEILRRAGTTAILVTHDRDEARTVAARVVDIDGLRARGVPLVHEVPAAATHDLRALVLRTGTVSSDVTFADDEAPATTHLAVTIDGRPVAISTWIEREHPDHPAVPAVQLRGMATAPDVRGEGLGALLLQAGLERASAAGSALAWANARITALDFYLAHGFEVDGPEFVSVDTGLPHRRIARRLD